MQQVPPAWVECLIRSVQCAVDVVGRRLRVYSTLYLGVISCSNMCLLCPLKALCVGQRVTGTLGMLLLMSCMNGL